MGRRSLMTKLSTSSWQRYLSGRQVASIRQSSELSRMISSLSQHDCDRVCTRCLYRLLKRGLHAFDMLRWMRPHIDRLAFALWNGRQAGRTSVMVGAIENDFSACERSTEINHRARCDFIFGPTLAERMFDDLYPIGEHRRYSTVLKMLKKGERPALGRSP